MHYRSVRDVYNEIEEVELEDVELLFAGVDEPTSYSQVTQEHSWKQAMKSEIEVVKRNNTQKQIELPSCQKAIDLKGFTS